MLCGVYCTNEIVRWRSPERDGEIRRDTGGRRETPSFGPNARVYIILLCSIRGYDLWRSSIIPSVHAAAAVDKRMTSRFTLVAHSLLVVTVLPLASLSRIHRVLCRISPTRCPVAAVAYFSLRRHDIRHRCSHWTNKNPC